MEVCPRCHHVLPVGIREFTVTCVAMAGARSTGKSLYVAVLIKQLEQLAERMNQTFGPLDESTRRTFADVYESPLYEERGMMQGTPPSNTLNAYQREPLIFNLGISSGRRHLLVLRDVAGEDLEAAGVESRRLEFFAHADGVFFMFDPLRVQEVRDQLQGLLPEQARLGGDPKVVLGNVLALVGAGSPKVAVILSKFDAMQALRSVQGTEWSAIMSNPGAAFLRDSPGGARAYDDADGELLHEEVRSLLYKLDATTMITAVENPITGRQLTHRFFAVSALGDSPNGEQLHRRGIAPFRTLDPLRWLLSGTGVL